MPPTRITRAMLLDACQRLAGRDEDLAGILRRYGPPPLWARRPGFRTLVQIILEQQVSLVSARAMFTRLAAHSTPLSPPGLRSLGPAGLRGLGVTRQKTRYLLDLAERVAAGRLNLRQVGRAPDDEARALLCEVTGIGPWTADVYLLMALRRPDVWPTADLALVNAVGRLRHQRRPPTETAVRRIADAWRPWRSVAARMVWHYYLAAAASSSERG